MRAVVSLAIISFLDAVSLRCLQLHPNADEVWLRAANWEFFQNGNIIGARKLLQRVKNESSYPEKIEVKFSILNPQRRLRK